MEKKGKREREREREGGGCWEEKKNLNRYQWRRASLFHIWMSICTIYTAGVKVETFPCQVKTLAANRFRILCHAIKLLGIKKLLPRMVVSTIKQILTVHTSDNQNHRRDTIWLSWLLNSLESIVVIEIYKRPNSHQYKWNPNPPTLCPRDHFKRENNRPQPKKQKE